MPFFIALSIVLATLFICELLVLAVFIFCVVEFLILGRTKEELGFGPEWFAMFGTAIICGVLGSISLVMWRRFKREIWPPQQAREEVGLGKTSGTVLSREEPHAVDNASPAAESLNTDENQWFINLAVSKMSAAGVEATVASQVAQKIKPELIAHFNQSQQDFRWVVGYIYNQMTAAGIDAEVSRRVANEILPDIMVICAIRQGPVRPHG